MSGDNQDNGNGNNGMRNVILGVLGGAVGIIVIKLLVKWVNGEI